MRIEKVLEESNYAIYTVELEPGFYVDVKAFRTGSKLIYVMQNEDGTVVYGGEERAVAPTCFYSEGVEKTIIDLVAMNEREVAASAPGTECPFCRKLEDMMASEKEWKASSRYKPGYSEEYTVACVNTTYYEGNVTSRLTSGGFALNFCPVCGKLFAVDTRNAPLTIDELRQIHGEPVYIKPYGWRVCYGIEPADIHDGIEKINLGNSCYLPLNGYGDRWIPYRQKPEDAE